MARFRAVVALILLLAAGGRAADATPATSTWEFLQWRGDLAFPVALRFAPDGRLFFNEVWLGRVRVFADTSAATSTIWADVGYALPPGERGLMGLALHPAFPDSPYVYIFHTIASPLVNRVARLTDQGGVGTNYTVIVDDLPSESSTHNGGRIAFGPDGMLYVTLGENNVPALAPNAADVRGKILRYTPMGVPAPGNPFGAGNPVFARGVRNPFGLCFDPLLGTGFFTDNGPDCDDEVNLLVAGADYGWGPADPCGSQPPGAMGAIANFTPTIAPTGCCVYRGALHPELAGNILFGAYNDGLLRRVVLHPTIPGLALGVEEMALDPVGGLVMDVTVGPGGGIWACGSNTILRAYPTSAVGGVGEPPRGLALDLGPNPFTTALMVRLPAGSVFERLAVLDLGGRRVRAWEGSLSGTIAWDGRDDTGRPAPAGVYLVRGSAQGREFSGRVVRLGR